MKVVELRDGTRMRKDVVDRHLRQLREYCTKYPVAMQIISTEVIKFTKDGIDDFASGHFTERDIREQHTKLVADFYDLEIKGLLNTFGSFQNQDNETEYQFSVNEIFCRVIKNSVTIQSSMCGADKLGLVLPYKNPVLRLSLPEKWEYSR